MKPGELRRWVGNELFGEAHMGISSGVWRQAAGGFALVIALSSYEEESESEGGRASKTFTQYMALVLVDWRLGWSPTYWLEQL